MADAALQGRIDAVRRRLPLAGVVEGHVKLAGSAGAKTRRGPCPFHAGKSASFSIKDNAARCFGCGWSGDVIRFVEGMYGLKFIEALKECEARAGIESSSGDRTNVRPAGSMPPVTAALEPRPVLRERNPAPPRRGRDKVLIETIQMARVLWRRARADHAAVRRYFMGRGVPEWVLGDARLSQFRYLSACPLMPWELRGPDDARAWPRDALIAPALLAMVRRPVWLEDETGLSGESDRPPAAEGADGTNVRPAGSMPPAGWEHDGSRGRWDFVPVGLHVTFLSPDGTGTMVRRRPWAKADDVDPLFPKRKMLGPVGHGAVLLGDWTPLAPVYAGEGNETVLSGMALADAPSEAVGLATLSLDNLQGFPRKWRGDVWPLFRIEPDPERRCFTLPGQQGPVTVLVDSDMAPLKRQKVVEAKGGPIIERAITGAERATICAELAVKGWRGAGVHQVRALRAPLGMDFNDVIVSRPPAGLRPDTMGVAA